MLTLQSIGMHVLQRAHRAAGSPLTWKNGLLHRPSGRDACALHICEAWRPLNSTSFRLGDRNSFSQAPTPGAPKAPSARKVQPMPQTARNHSEMRSYCSFVASRGNAYRPMLDMCPGFTASHRPRHQRSDQAIAQNELSMLLQWLPPCEPETGGS